MCGIAGVYNRASGAPVSPEVLEAMVDCLCHRGPDQQATFRDGPLGFAHRRLKIIALVDDGDLVFGSEIKALLCDPRLRPQLDLQALADLLVLRYVAAPATMFAG